MNTKCSLFVIVLALGVLAGPAGAELKGYDDNLSDSLPAVLIDIDKFTGNASVPPELSLCPGGANPPNTVFGVGFTSGLTFVGETLYGIEFDPVTGTDIFLYTLDTSFCAQGVRVAGAAVGFEILESLAYCPDDGFLYSVDFEFAAHEGQLIRIDPATGTGVAVDPGRHMARDVWIVGLAYDSESGQLFGASNGYGARDFQELYVIDIATGVETLVGATGTAAETLQSLALDSSMQPATLLAASTELYRLDRGSGAATLLGGTYNGTVWGLAKRPADTSPTPQVSTPTQSATLTRTPSKTPTQDATSTPKPCFGDCDGNGTVRVAELIKAVNIALGLAAVDLCRAVDANGDGSVSISELVRAVNAALVGCNPDL